MGKRDGLIGQLRPDAEERPGHWASASDAFHAGRAAGIDMVRDLLRSPETRDRLAKVLYESVEGNPPVTPTDHTVYYEDADAVIRVLTGEAGDER